MEALNFNRLSEGSSLKGVTHVCGDFYVAGKIEGDLFMSDGILLVEPTGEISGTIKGQDMQVLGKVSGDIFSSGQVTIKASGVISGTIHAKAMKVFPGAVIESKLDIEYSS